MVWCGALWREVAWHERSVVWCGMAQCGVVVCCAVLWGDVAECGVTSRAVAWRGVVVCCGVEWCSAAQCGVACHACTAATQPTSPSSRITCATISFSGTQGNGGGRACPATVIAFCPSCQRVARPLRGGGGGGLHGAPPRPMGEMAANAGKREWLGVPRGTWVVRIAAVRFSFPLWLNRKALLPWHNQMASHLQFLSACHLVGPWLWRVSLPLATSIAPQQQRLQLGGNVCPARYFSINYPDFSPKFTLSWISPPSSWYFTHFWQISRVAGTRWPKG